MLKSAAIWALLRGLIAIVLALVVWEIAARQVGPRYWPSVSSLMDGLINVYITWGFARYASISIQEFLTGYGLAVIIGVPLGVALAFVPPVRLILGALTSALAAAPLAALAPVMVMWFGTSENMAGKSTLGFIAAVFPIAGFIMDSVQPKIGGVRFSLLQPAAFNSFWEAGRTIVASLRIGATHAAIAVLVCDMISPVSPAYHPTSLYGAGYAMLISVMQFDTKSAVSIFVAIAIPLVILNRTLATIEWWLARSALAVK